MKQVHFALFDEPMQPWEGERDLRGTIDVLAKYGGEEFAPTESLESADLIVFLESNNYKNWRIVDRLLAHPAIRRHPDRCFTTNYSCSPVKFLAGVYVNMPQSRHEAGWTVAGGYRMGNPNTVIQEYERRQATPRLLFSFRGAMSNPLRSELLRHADAWRDDGSVTHVGRWFDHTQDEARAYVEEVQASEFVLCPRGLGAATHRMFETMRLGRVPVVVADDWLQPPGPDWAACSVRVREGEIDSIPERLRARRGEAAAMGRAAREVWEKWFAPDVVLVQQLRAIADLAARKRSTDLARRWRSRSFRREHGWTLPQRVARLLRRLVRK